MPDSRSVNQIPLTEEQRRIVEDYLHNCKPMTWPNAPVGGLRVDTEDAGAPPAVTNAKRILMSDPRLPVDVLTALRDLQADWEARSAASRKKLKTTKIPLWEQAIWSTYSICAEELAALISGTPPQDDETTTDPSRRDGS